VLSLIIKHGGPQGMASAGRSRLTKTAAFFANWLSRPPGPVRLPSLFLHLREQAFCGLDLIDDLPVT